jgi:hypothetical protein
VTADAGLDGCWFTQSPLTPDEDPIKRVRTTGDAPACSAPSGPSPPSTTRPSEDFGTVVTQGPVARFTRTPAVAGDTPRIFGLGQPDGWAESHP